MHTCSSAGLTSLPSTTPLRWRPPTRCALTPHCTRPTRTAPAHPTGSSPPSTTLPTSIWSPPGRGSCARRVPPPPTSSTCITSLRSTKLLHVSPPMCLWSGISTGPNSCCSRRSRPGLRCTGSTPRSGPNACAAGRPPASGLWRHLLVERPCGWCPGGEPGSVAYAPHLLRSFAQGPVLLYVGRFTAVKRLGLLISAYSRAQASFAVPAPLVLLGGFPGEWEGEHPLDTIQRTGARDVFLAGWHDHDELPDIFAASDVVVLPSVREQFGQVLVEGMACGLPAIAVAAHGPSEIVEDGQTGWLVPPDDEEALAAALVMAVNDAHERRRRGAAAYAAVRTRYGWPIVGAQLAFIYEALLGLSPVT